MLMVHSYMAPGKQSFEWAFVVEVFMIMHYQSNLFPKNILKGDYADIFMNPNHSGLFSLFTINISNTSDQCKKYFILRFLIELAPQVCGFSIKQIWSQTL